MRPKSRRFAARFVLGPMILGSLVLAACTAAWPQSPNLQPLLRSGQAALDADDYARAAASFERARQIAPDNLQASRGLVLSYLQLGRLSEAARIGEESVARWPGDAQLQHWLG
ncbi:MAG: tetratricopeptide repeat protein, partial [Terriglobales bacterium]